MSRIGKQPIEILNGVEVLIQPGKITVKGEKGELSLDISKDILVEQKENQLIVSIKRRTKQSNVLWGLTRSLLQNCVIGVSKGFQKTLELVGVGYKASVNGEVLEIDVGYSHPIKMEIPKSMSVSVEKNKITVSGIDKQKVGQFAAKIRAHRKPEPYKGKGIRYEGEKVRRKEGKKAATAGS